MNLYENYEKKYVFLDDPVQTAELKYFNEDVDVIIIQLSWYRYKKRKLNRWMNYISVFPQFELTSMSILYAPQDGKRGHVVAATQFCDKLVFIDSNIGGPIAVNWKSPKSLLNFMKQRRWFSILMGLDIVMTRRTDVDKADLVAARRSSDYYYGYRENEGQSWVGGRDGKHT
jgi:hypothetical protein